MQNPSTPANDLESSRKRANLNKSVEISRRQFEHGECFDHATVLSDVHAELKALSDSARLPNAETIAALEEGDRIASDPTRRRYSVDEALAELKR